MAARIHDDLGNQIIEELKNCPVREASANVIN